MLDEGRYASITELAAAERIERGYLGSLLRVTLLAPDIVEAILDGRQPNGLCLAGLAGPVPVLWSDQRVTFGETEVGGPWSSRAKAGQTGLAPRPSL
jgi:hypothetical protein